MQTLDLGKGCDALCTVKLYFVADPPPPPPNSLSS